MSLLLCKRCVAKPRIMGKDGYLRDYCSDRCARNRPPRHRPPPPLDPFRHLRAAPRCQVCRQRDCVRGKGMRYRRRCKVCLRKEWARLAAKTRRALLKKRRPPHLQRIYEAIRAGASDPHKIAEMFGVSLNTVQKACILLLQRGDVRRPRKGIYQPKETST